MMSRIIPLATTATFLLLAASLVTDSVTAQKARIITSCTVPHTVALTFDDGPFIYTQGVFDTLKAAGAQGTFFVNGNNYGCIYDDDNAAKLLYVVQHGHQIASHTWSHKDLTTLSEDQINNEMLRMEQAIQKITGRYPAFTRPPYGNYNDRVGHVAAKHSQSVVIWDFDSGDSTGSSTSQSDAALDNLIDKKPSTILTLMHDVYEDTVMKVLPYAIKELQAAGYKLVTVAECVGMKPYLSVQDPSVRDSTWTCK